jgi:hypothetical protein
MADVNFDDYHGGHDWSGARLHGLRLQRMVNLAGAVTSIALVIGVGVWGYKLAVRDVTGVPVIRALEGPMRIAPDDPGGEIAAHQGLAVNSIAEDGLGDVMPERIVLAPRPVELTLEDQPGISGVAPAKETLLPVAVSGEPTLSIEAPALLTAIAAPDAPEALAEIATGEDVAVEGETMADTGDGLARSPRPKVRPEGDTVAEAIALAAAASFSGAAAQAEVDPATLAPGTRLVQLGAFDDAEGARHEWDKLAARFGELLADKTRVVQSAQSGGRTFFRLRALGFTDEADARRFCSALLAENAACIPVAIR